MEVGEDSVAEAPPPGSTGQTLDHWAWIARARAAARRAVEPGVPQAGPLDDHPAEPPGTVAD